MAPNSPLGLTLSALTPLLPQGREELQDCHGIGRVCCRFPLLAILSQVGMSTLSGGDIPQILTTER